MNDPELRKFLKNIPCSVSRTVIHDDDAVGVWQHTFNNAGQSALIVVGRNEDTAVEFFKRFFCISCRHWGCKVILWGDTGKSGFINESLLKSAKSDCLFSCHFSLEEK